MLPWRPGPGRRRSGVTFPKAPAERAGEPRIAEIRREEGDTRGPDEFEIHVISYDAYTPDGVKRLEDRGVTDCIVGFRSPYIEGPDTEPLETKIKHLEQYVENVIAKVDR